jgi:hypothetical protein
VTRKATFLLLLLVLLIAPAANLWCSTVCVAAAISSGCAHGLQPTDDLPMDRAVVAIEPPVMADAIPEFAPGRGPEIPAAIPERHTPLRI